MTANYIRVCPPNSRKRNYVTSRGSQRISTEGSIDKTWEQVQTIEKPGIRRKKPTCIPNSDVRGWKESGFRNREGRRDCVARRSANFSLRTEQKRRKVAPRRSFLISVSNSPLFEGRAKLLPSLLPKSPATRTVRRVHSAD